MLTRESRIASLSLTRSIGVSSRSYSSWISPTISSSKSSIVTRPAVLVHHDGDVHLALPQLGEQFIHSLRLRDEVWRPRHVAQRRTAILRQAAQQVLRVDNADDV